METYGSKEFKYVKVQYKCPKGCSKWESEEELEINEKVEFFIDNCPLCGTDTLSRDFDKDQI